MGGRTTSGLPIKSHTVMAYDKMSNQWHLLSLYHARSFTMTTIQNNLVLVGDHHGEFDYCAKLSVWQSNIRKWTEYFPPTPTARSRASTTFYKHWVVIAGGCSVNGFEYTVEILNLDINQWCNGPHLPSPWAAMKSTVLEDTWYLIGSLTEEEFSVYSVSLEALVIQEPSSSSSNIWQEITPLATRYFCLLIVRGTLLAVGGWNRGRTNSAIFCYTPESTIWLQADVQLPLPLHNCASVMVADRMYVFGGENRNGKHREMYHMAE